MNINQLLTIVVPCKNEERYILRLLDSLRMQKLSGTRIIIADCSTDNTRKIIADHSEFLNVEIIQGGPVSFARNQAAGLATTPYVFFIDADVIFFNEKINPSLLFHSKVIGEFGVNFLPSLICQRLLLSGTFISDLVVAQPDSTK